MTIEDDNRICIIQRQGDGTFAYAGDDGVIELGETLPGAVNALDELGIHATHWLPKVGNMTEIPAAIVRRHLPDADPATFRR